MHNKNIKLSGGVRSCRRNTHSCAPLIDELRRQMYKCAQSLMLKLANILLNLHVSLLFEKKSEKSNISLKILQLQMEQLVSFKIVSDTHTVHKTSEKLYLQWSPSASIDCSLEVALYFQAVARYTLRICH